MKKLILALAMLPVLGANAQTVKKVVIEDLTGIHCGWCPEGAVLIDGLKAANSANVLPIAIHTGSYTPSSSPLKTPEGDAVNAMAAVYGYPAGMVDRKFYTPAQDANWTGAAMNRGYWTNAFNARKATAAIVSVGFGNAHKLTDSTYEMDVTAKFSSAPVAGTPLKLQVYIIEDSIVANSSDPNLKALLQQDNYSTAVQGGASPLNPWYHNHVLRQALGGTWGYTVIPATPAVGTAYTQHVTFKTKSGASPTGWVNKNIRVYAFVAYDGAATADKKEILNGEEMMLKSFFPVGVKDVNPVSIQNAYPNPASANDVVRIEYNIQESSKVSMKVYNAIGQLVAEPYVSQEVQGTHTIQWKPADNGLTSGMYIINVSTKDGSMVQRITVQ